jgi:acetyltransferase-like isoleucine patch superfamily enzyme
MINIPNRVINGIDGGICGDRCLFGKDVIISGFKKQPTSIHIGQNVRFMDYVRICLDGNLVIEDGVTLHNHVSIIGSGDCYIKKNTWIAQYTSLDCEGGLEIGEDCCIGFNCQIWSHVCRVPRLKNIRFHSIKKTTIKDRVWLMGGLITIAPGVTIEDDCVIFSNSVVSKDTEPNKVYAGIPAKIIEKYDSTYIEE